MALFCTLSASGYDDTGVFAPSRQLYARRMPLIRVVFGGGSGGSALNTTLLLDVQTMAFTAGPNLLTGRFGCAAVQID
jgi:hypothetical protein